MAILKNDSSQVRLTQGDELPKEASSSFSERTGRGLFGDMGGEDPVPHLGGCDE